MQQRPKLEFSPPRNEVIIILILGIHEHLAAATNYTTDFGLYCIFKKTVNLIHSIKSARLGFNIIYLTYILSNLFSNVDPSSQHLVPCISLSKCLDPSTLIPNTKVTELSEAVVEIECENHGKVDQFFQILLLLFPQIFC